MAELVKSVARRLKPEFDLHEIWNFDPWSPQPLSRACAARERSSWLAHVRNLILQS